MGLKISPNTIGLMAATMLPILETYDLESMLFGREMQAYGDFNKRTVKQLALEKVAVLACDVAKAIEDELDRRSEDADSIGGKK
jgi:hypothetical protein